MSQLATSYSREQGSLSISYPVHIKTVNPIRKRMQMGLVVGFLVNVLFGMWRFLLDAS
jgi:hypothetical protein